MAIKTNQREAMRFAGASLFEGGGAGIMSSQALAQELTERQQEIIDKRLGQEKGAGSGTFVPVGLMQTPRISDLGQVPSLYPVLQRSSAIPSQVARIPATPNTGFLHPEFGIQINKTVAGKRRPQVVAPQVQIRPPVIPRPGPIGPGRVQPTNIVSQGAEMAIDLGSLITGLGTTYINARYPQQQNVDWSSSLPEFLGLGSAEPGMVATVAAGCPIIPKGYFINDKGEVRKKPKRRRRRLATPSDIKDLAALSSVTNAPQKNTWIATHPS